MSELIPTEPYANLTLGPASVLRFVNENEVEQGIEKCVEEIRAVLGEERDRIKGYEGSD